MLRLLMLMLLVLLCLLWGTSRTKDRGVVWHLRWSRMLVLFGRLDDLQILHIASAEHNVFVDLVAWGNFIVAIGLISAFCTERCNLLERDCAI